MVNVATSITMIVTPPTGGDFPTGTASFAYSKSRMLSKSVHRTLIISGANNQDVFPDDIQAAKVLYARVRGGSVVWHVTSADGLAQTIPCDDVFVLHSATRPVTGLAVSGTAEVELLLIGE